MAALPLDLGRPPLLPPHPQPAPPLDLLFTDPPITWEGRRCCLLSPHLQLSFAVAPPPPLPPPPPIPCGHFHWASVVSELTRDAVELHGLSLRVVDRHTSAWVCIDVRTVIPSNDVVYNLPNAHISLASVEFRAVPDSKTMRAASLTRTHFFQQVSDIELILRIWRRGG